MESSVNPTSQDLPQPSLLKQRRFLPYFCTQFLGAFNDNIFKNALAIFITYQLAAENQGILLNIAAVLFILPFFLFGAIAGQLADKYEKSWLIRRIKVAEIIIMLIGCVGLYLQSIGIMLGVLFLLGAQSAFFGPIKYSILPQHLERNQILGANSYVEAGTFIAILIGTIAGGLLAGDAKYQAILMATLVCVACSGWLVSRQIPSAAPAAPDLKVSFNIWRSTLQIIRMTRTNKPVFLAILAISWFWFFGSIVLTQFPTFAKEILYGNANVATLLLATFSIGIGLGSWACAQLSGGKVEIGLMPIGALGISIFTLQLSNTVIPASPELRTLMEMLATDGSWWVVFNMTMIAFSAGIFIVPLYAFIQIRSADANRSRVIAVNNILNSVFMVTAGILAATMIYFGFSVLQIFKVAAVLNLIVTIYILSVVPEFFLRLVSWVLVHSVYKIRKIDMQYIPEEGPALLVCNHVSFVDPALLVAAFPRPARFVMYHSFYELPIANKLFRGMKAIPIATKRDNQEVADRAFDTIAEELETGHLVCVFPEGKITRDGEMARFQPGIEQIIKRTPVPVVPLAMCGLWGSWFSRHKGSAMSGIPQGFRKEITIVAAEPVLPEEMNRVMLYEKVLALRGDKK